MRYHDRTDAGRALAEALFRAGVRPALVAAIPRGGVVVAAPVALRFGVPLAVVHARRIASPLAPRTAYAAVDEDGEAVVDYAKLATLRLGARELDAARRSARDEVRRRRDLYGQATVAARLPAAAVVLVDDGLRTGLTMAAALAFVRRHGAKDVTVAVPCASADAAEQFRRDADGFVSPVVQADFRAVADYYEDFPVVEDALALELLARIGGRDLREDSLRAPGSPMRGAERTVPHPGESFARRGASPHPGKRRAS